MSTEEQYALAAGALRMRYKIDIKEPLILGAL